MTREDLKKALKELNERRNNEIKQNAYNLHEIQKKRNEVVRNADDVMRVKNMQESIRHKNINSNIEQERQQLFADYKSQNKID